MHLGLTASNAIAFSFLSNDFICQGSKSNVYAVCCLSIIFATELFLRLSLNYTGFKTGAPAYEINRVV